MSAQSLPESRVSAVTLCRHCGAPTYFPDYGGDLDDFHTDDHTPAWPYCTRSDARKADDG